jgi:hypothetical protein
MNSLIGLKEQANFVFVCSFYLYNAITNFIGEKKKHGIKPNSSNGSPEE